MGSTLGGQSLMEGVSDNISLKRTVAVISELPPGMVVAEAPKGTRYLFSRLLPDSLGPWTLVISMANGRNGGSLFWKGWLGNKVLVFVSTRVSRGSGKI